MSSNRDEKVPGWAGKTLISRQWGLVPLSCSLTLSTLPSTLSKPVLGLLLVCDLFNSLSGILRPWTPLDAPMLAGGPPCLISSAPASSLLGYPGSQTWWLWPSGTELVRCGPGWCCRGNCHPSTC